MALIENINEFNKYITVSSGFDLEKLLKYAKKAERKIIQIIGQEKFNEIENAPTVDETRILLCEYSANMGLYYGLSGFVLNITSYGVFTNNTSDSVQAEWWQVRDLKRDLIQFAFSSLDEALNIIGIDDNNITDGLWVSTVKQFDRVFNINGSSQTFLSLIPFMREVQDQFISATLGDCADYNFTDKQKELIRAAIVNLTIARAATSGAFSIEGNAVVLRIEVLPWEKVEKIEQTAIEKFQTDRFNVGMGYLNKVLSFVKELPCYSQKNFKSDIEKLKSGLYL